MFFASNKRRNKRSGHASTTYVNLEQRQLLTIVPNPVQTTNVADFAVVVDDAVVRVDDRRLIIRTTGEENRIDISLEFGYLQVNRDSVFSTALQIDTQQYDRIVLLSGGDDDVRVTGRNITAQLHPDRLWFSGESLSFDGEAEPIQINGSDFEHVEVLDSNFRDFGPSVIRSENRIRFHGSDGVDRLDMRSGNNFAISTSVSLTGEDYSFYANAFGDLFVDGGGGDDFASLAGTRGFEPDAFFANDQTGLNGDDVYYGRDNFSRISNDLWDARFVNFETQRVDLLSGLDRSVVEDTERPSAHYRVVGEDLVGGFRRMVGVESIEIIGNQNSTEVLVGVTSEDGVLLQEDDVAVLSNDFPLPNNSPFLPEVFPRSYQWQFRSFDRIG